MSNIFYATSSLELIEELKSINAATQRDGTPSLQFLYACTITVWHFDIKLPSCETWPDINALV